MSEPGSVSEMIAALNNLWTQIQELSARISEISGDSSISLRAPLQTNGYSILGGTQEDVPGLQLHGNEGSVIIQPGTGLSTLLHNGVFPGLIGRVVTNSTVLDADSFNGSFVRIAQTMPSNATLTLDDFALFSGLSSSQSESWYCVIVNESMADIEVSTSTGNTINSGADSVLITPFECRTFYRINGGWVMI